MRAGRIEGTVINKQGDSLELWDRKNQTNNPDNGEDGHRQAGFNKTAVAYTELWLKDCKNVQMLWKWEAWK